MEVKILQGIQAFKWVDTDNMIRNPFGFVQFNHGHNPRVGMFMAVQSRRKRVSVHNKSVSFRVLNSLNNSQGSVLQSSGLPASLDESLVLKNKSSEIQHLLDGRCIYLVGMMGSGKTTIGRVLSEALNYSCSDSDSLVEQKMEGMSVAEIFKQHGEDFFRDKETEVLKELSMMSRLVISTGGGAVIRPINWKHMRSGISAWLDVPLECLARRISAVGTGTRPLLHGESDDAYSVALKRLSSLLEAREKAYANADTRVSLESIALRLGCGSVDNLSPTVIAIEVLEQIEKFLKVDGFTI